MAYFHQRILEVLGRRTPVLAMGDFNDEPFDTSLVRHALAERSPTKVSHARSSVFLNLMWPVMGQASGTFYYGNRPFVFDQFFANQSLLSRRATIRARPESVAIHCDPVMVASGEYPRPVRYGGMGRPVDPAGCSDHFPVTLVLEETV